MMKLNATEGLLTFILIFSLSINLLNSRIKKENEEIPQTILVLKDNIKEVDQKGKNIIVIFTSGIPYDAESKIIPFVEKTVINNIKKGLEKTDYTVITIGTPCLASTGKCLQDFSQLGEAIVSLHPKALIYKGIDSGIANELFNETITHEKIPVYTFGTQVSLDYKIYTGPDNKRLGQLAFEGIENFIKPNQSAIYLETVIRSADPVASRFDNGYPRINEIRTLMTNKGVKQKATLFTQWSQTLTYTQLKKLMEEEGAPDYIITPSAETANGAVEAVKELKLQNKVKIITLDFTEEIAKMVKDEKVYAAVSQGLLRQAKYILNDIENPENSEKVNKLFAGPFITKETLEQYPEDSLY